MIYKIYLQLELNKFNMKNNNLDIEKKSTDIIKVGALKSSEYLFALEDGSIGVDSSYNVSKSEEPRDPSLDFIQNENSNFQRDTDINTCTGGYCPYCGQTKSNRY